MPDCELCGRSADDMYVVEVDGVKMQVCRACTRHGKFIGKVRREQPTPIRKPHKMTEEEEEVEMLVPDYGDRIRKKRNELGLKREELAKKLNETESVIRRLEHGDMVPDDKLVRKLEKTLGITLREKVEVKRPEAKHDTQEGLTLGDVVKIKKK